MTDALRFAPRAGRAAPYGRWPTLNLVIEALAVAGRIDEAAALYPVAEDMLRLGYAVMWAGEALPRTTAGIAAACARDWARAVDHHQAAVRLADTMGLKVCQPIARYWFGEMLLARGESSRARALFGEALNMFESIGMPLYGREAAEKLSAP